MDINVKSEWVKIELENGFKYIASPSYIGGVFEIWKGVGEPTYENKGIELKDGERINILKDSENIFVRNLYSESTFVYFKIGL